MALTRMLQRRHARTVRLCAGWWFQGWACAMALPAAAAPAVPLAFQSSADVAHVRRVVRALGQQHTPGAFFALRDALHEGLPDAVADEALLALGEHGSQEAQELLREFMVHHRPTARIAAYRAFVARASPLSAGEILSTGLGDGDAQVREACAQLMAEHGSAQHVPRLMAALAQGTQGAISALYQWGGDDLLPSLAAHGAAMPAAVMRSGYERALLRSDVLPATQVRLVQQLEAQGTPDARRFLERMLLQRDWSAYPAVRAALTAAIARLPKDEAQLRAIEERKS